MRARSLISGTLLLLFVSSWGSVLAAPLCPHMAPDHSCCHAMNAPSPMSHQAMDGMHGMSNMQMEAVPVESPDSRAFIAHETACEHCASQSHLPATGTTLREAGLVKSSLEIAAPLAITPFALPITAILPAVLSRPHAPPGATARLHILISLFRI